MLVLLQDKTFKTRPPCLVCQKVPGLYALLTNCSHAFCVCCINRAWNCLPPDQRKCVECGTRQSAFVPSNVWRDQSSTLKQDKLRSHFLCDREDISTVLRHLTHRMTRP